MRKQYTVGEDVKLAIKIVDDWYSKDSNINKVEPDGLTLARFIIQRRDAVELTSEQKTAPELLDACKKAIYIYEQYRQTSTKLSTSMAEQVTKLLMAARIYRIAFWAAVDIISQLNGDEPTDIGVTILRAAEKRVLEEKKLQPDILDWFKSFFDK